MPTKSLSDLRVPLTLLSGMLAIAFAAIFFKLASPTHPLVASGLRLAIASLLLSPWLLRALKRRTMSLHVMKAAVVASIFYAVHFGAWVWSLDLTTVAASVSLVTATPLMLALWGVIRRQDAPTGGIWLAIAVSSLGVFIVSGADFEGSTLLGNALALLGAVAMAGYMLTVRWLGVIDVLAFGSATAGLASMWLLSTAILLGQSIVPPSPTAAFFILMAALVPQIIGHSVITWVLRYTTPTIVGLATLIEPVASSILAWVLLEERPGTMVFLGCGLTLIGVSIALLLKPR